MNKFLLLIISLLWVSIQADAQTFLQVGNGTDTAATAFSAFAPVYRASSNSGSRANRSNTLYEASELSAIPPGAQITALAWEKSNAGGTIPGNPLRLEIWMNNSTLVAPLATTTLWSSIQATHTLVYNNLDAVIPAVPGWINFTLDQPFVYTGGGLEIATENQIGGSSPYATDRLNWKFTAGTGDYVIGVTGSTSFGGTLSNTTSGGKNRSNIRIFYTVPLPLDLQAAAVLSPVPPVNAGSVQQVQLEMFNGGTTAVTSANIHYRLNGGTVVTESWMGNLAPSANLAVAFATPLNIPTTGTQEVQVWVSNVNGQGADGNPANDTATSTFCLALPAGAYTVGTANADFSSIDAAVTALNCGGIAGPVSFLIAPGNYTGFYELHQVAGASAANDILFTSATGVTGDVVIYNDSSAVVPEVFLLNGTKGVTFSFLKFVRNYLPTPATHILHMRLGAERIQVVNCEFEDGVGVITANNRAVGMFSVNEVALIGNRFEGFGHPIFAVGEAFDLNNQWINNSFHNYLNDAMFIQSQQGAVIRGNIFQDFQGTGTTVAACSLRAQRNVTVEENRVLGAIPRYAFNLFDFDNHPSGPNRIINNEVVGFTTSTITSGTAIRQCYVITGFQNANLSPVNIKDQYDFINNTAYLGVNSGSGSTLQALLAISGGSDALPSIDTIRVMNNNLVAYASVPGGLPAGFRIMNFNVQAPINTSWSDHNNFYFEEAPNAVIRRNSPAEDYQTVAAWTLAQGGRDSSSLSVNPLFLSRQLARPTADTLDNRGSAAPGILTDIEGAVRSTTTPDIGAYEFEVPPVELAFTGLVAPQSACGLSDSSQVVFQIQNLGTDTLFAAELLLLVNGQLVETKVFTDTLLAGSSRALQFDGYFDFSIGGRYEIEVYPSVRVDANPSNDTLRTLVVNELINNFPFVENFEGYINGIPAFENGWTSTVSSYRWFINNGGTSTNATGPAFDATAGTANGRYIYVESTNGGFGQEANITSSCLDLSGLTQPMLEFWYHGHGIDCYQLITEQEVAGLWQPIDTIFGPVQRFSRDAWARRRLQVSPSASKIRFIAVRGNSFEGDWAIDDIRIAEFPTQDVRVSALEVQADRCDSTTTANFVVQIANAGSVTQSAVPVVLRVNGVNFNATLQRSLAAGASDTLQWSLPLTQFGNNQVLAYTALAGDQDLRLDTLSRPVFLTGTIQQFPYQDDFEGLSLWHSGGINSSWQRSTPSATVINSAFNGNGSWVTNAFGLANAEETSWLESPCFDLSNLVQPELSFAIWYNMPNTAGANLQYSTDGGQSWQVLGGPFSGSSWYTADSVAISGGQPVWTGVVNPSAWQIARQSLAALAGQASVKFRFQLFSPPSSILGEGIAIDRFRIADPATALPLQLSITPEQCQPAVHLVTVASFTNASALQSSEVRYSVDGAVEQSVSFAPIGGALQASIPAQMPGAEVRWYVRTQNDSGVYAGPSATYRDGYAQPFLSNVQAPAGNNLQLDALTAIPASLATGQAGTASAGGVRLAVTAHRHLTISQIELGLQKATSLELYFALEQGGAASFDLERAERVAVVANARPDTAGNFAVLLQRPLRLQAGDRGVLYVKAFDSTSLRIEANPVQPMVQDSNLTLGDGLVVPQPFGPGTTAALPAMRVQVASPVDSIRWSNATVSPVVLGTARQLSITVPSSPLAYYLEFETDGCVRRDTFWVSPAQSSDLGVEAFLPLPTTLPQWTGPVAVEVVLRNHDVFASAPVQLQLFEPLGGIAVTETLSRSIPAGDTIHYRFAPQIFTIGHPNLGVFGVRFCVAVAPDSNVLNDTLCITQAIDSVVSVPEQAGLQWQMYPNPASDWVQLSWNSNAQGPIFLQLRDAVGRVVQSVQLPAGSESHRLELGGLSGGVYHLSFEQNGGRWHRKLILKH